MPYCLAGGLDNREHGLDASAGLVELIRISPGRTLSGRLPRSVSPMIVTVTLRVRSEELAHGQVIGWVEAIVPGTRWPVRSGWELVNVLRAIAADAATATERTATRP